MSSREIIGKRFGSWSVIEKVKTNKKYSYYYLCRCDCGYSRTFRKDKLVEGRFSVCNKCNSESVVAAKHDIITKFWDKNINGDLEISNVSLKRNYNWRCPEGHIFYENVIDLIGCPICLESKSLDTLPIQQKSNFLYCLNLLRTTGVLLDVPVDVYTEKDIMYAEIHLGSYVFVVYPRIYNSYNENIFKTKTDFLKTKQEIQQHISKVRKGSRSYTIIDVTLNRKVDGKKIKKNIKKVLHLIKDSCII